ncbi:HAD family hydrolase [Propionibacteriaceae bacterium Y1685]
MTTDAAGRTGPTTTSTSTEPALQAVLWDFDGTLADSEHLWMNAEYELIPTLGGEWNEEHAKNLVGNSLLTSARYILEAINRPDLEPEWIVDQLTARVVAQLESGDIPWRPGALELLAALEVRGIPCALVSASYRRMLDVVVQRLPQGRFDVVVSGDEVTNGKPHPEPYLTAASMLGVDPERCVVIEDSAPGSASGNAAGAVVLAVHNMVDIPVAERRVPLDTLAGVTVDQVQGWLADA